MKSLNLNHRFLRAMLLVLLATFGITNAWADLSHGKHYGRANVAVASGSTGAGTVYLTENSTQKTQSTGWQCFSGNNDGSSDKDSKSFSCTCEGWTDGYYFAGWSTNGSTVPSSYTSTSATANLTFTATSESSPGDLYYYAWILGVKPTGASGDVSLDVANLSTTYTKTVSFTQTGGDAQADFNDATIVLKSGGGTWTHVSTTYNSSTKKVDVQFTYTANRSSWTNAAGNRSDKATLTLSSKGGESYAAEITANLPNVTISAGTGSSITLTNATETKSGSATFPVSYVDSKSDLNEPTIAKTSGEGTWAITSYSYADGVVMVNYSHTGSGTYGTRASAATITLTAKAGGASNTCNVTASYPALAVTGGEDTGAYPLETEDATGTATFFVSHADALADFTIPTAVANSTGGTWTVDASSAVYTQSASDPSSGTVAISYTYNAGDLFGAKTAELTLTGTNGSSYVLTLTGERAAPADQDVSVTTAGGVETKYDTWAEGLAAANTADGCTLKLLRDVSGLTATQEITKTMTLDLSHYTLSGTLSASGGLIKLNTAGKTLTITDSKSDGAITVSGNVANRISAVEILKGSLVLSKVTLTAENANTGDTQANIYCATVYLAAGTTMTMTSGNITANRTGASGSYCYGVYCAGTGSSASSVNLSGSTITAEFANGNYAEGVYAAGNSMISDMTISGSAKTCAYAIWAQDGHLVVNGGTYTGTTSTSTARAIYTKTNPATKNALIVQNATLNATAGTTDAKGIYCQSTSATISGDPTDANIALSNVTINAKTEGASATTSAFAVYSDAGVCLAINGGTYNATTKTTTAYAVRSSGYTAILNGTFNANATTYLARALFVEGGITAVKGGTFTAMADTEQAHATYVASGAKLLIYGGTFRGVCNTIKAGAWATGTLVIGTLEAQGGTFIGEASKPNLTTTQKAYSAGMYVYAGSNVSLSNVSLRGELKSNYLTNGGSSDWTGGAYGVYSNTTNPFAITNSTLTAVSAYQGGFGIRLNSTPATIKNCTVTVTTTYAYNYGIFTTGTADVQVENSTITATSGTTYAYGAYVYGGKLSASECSFSATTQRTGATAADNCNLFGINVYTGKSATLNGCTITATGSGSYSNNGYGVYVNGSADIDDCIVTVSGINSGAYAICNTSNTTRIGVASGKFKATATSTGVSCNGTAAVGKQYLYGGYYNTKNNLEKYLPEGYGMEILPNSSPEYQEGYRYAIRANTIIDPVCKIGTTPYTTLEEALEFVNQNTGTAYTITMVKGYTLPAGDYTLPAKATLLVPYNGQTAPKTHPDRVYAYTTPSANIKLTFAANAHMDVLGTIEVGSKQAANGQTAGKNGCPHESYGWIYMNEGSTITLEGGAQLYAWGYITGAGEIDAKRNSTVHEMFQLLDWRGGSASSGMIGNSQRCMPVNQYAIQNIECPIKFRPGSAELCDGTVNASSSAYPFNDVKLIGIETTVTDNKSLFMMKNEDMSEDTWVRKRYDATKDQQIYEVNSSAYLGGIRLKVGNIPLIGNIDIKSTDYVMPITNNMKIHVLTGKLEITQDMELTPGAEIEIDKEATAYIQSGTSLYVFDLEEWDPFSYDKNNNPDAHSYKVPYSPTKGSISQKRVISKDADLNIHGKIVVTGNLYTTAGGANVFSTNEDAGTITYNTAASASDIKLYVCNNTSKTYNSKTYYPAWLKNGAEITPVYSETNGTAKDKSWIYYNDQWNCWEERGCFGYDAQDHPYAKPRAWVQLKRDVADETTHLYVDAATETRAFIVEEGCTWWEVEPTPYDGNKYKCVDPDYDGRYKYYEYKDNKWQEATVTITWKNGLTTLATYSNALYGVRPTYLDAHPAKPATSSEFYTWVGWTKDNEDEGEYFAKEDELPFATEENTTYYAKFETHKYQYAVLFKNYDGSVLQGTPWEAGQVPYYTGSTPVKPSTAALTYTFTGWSPANFTAVTGTGDVYTAQFDAGTPRTYTIQWVNYNGTVLKEEQVAYGSTPTEPTTPTRPNDAFYTYTFNSWTPEISSVTGNQTYTATYDYEKKVTKYSVTFKNGSTTIYTQNLVANSVPVFDGTLPTKAADAQYTYSFDGWSTTEGGLLAYAPDATLPALTANVTYYAHFATTGNTYTIRWKSVDDKITYETDTDVPYGATPEYNGSKPTKARQGATVYTFDGWSATIGGAKITLPLVTGHATYYAHFSDDPVYTVTFDANGHGTAPSSQEVVENQHVIEPAALSAAEWIFGGWYKEAECTNAWDFASDVVTGNTTLFAKWTAAVASVTANGITTYYKTLPEAFTAANSKSECTIRLLKNVSGISASGCQLTYTKANGICTLDLNNCTVSGSVQNASNPKMMQINATGATFTITDNSQEKGGKFQMTKSSARGTYYAIQVSAGTLVVNNGYIYSDNQTTLNGTGYTYGSNAIQLEAGTSLQVNGGKIESKALANARAINALGSSSVTITNGTFIATTTYNGSSDLSDIAATVYTDGGTTTINNGTFTATTAKSASHNIYATSASQTINVSGGKFEVSGGTTTQNINDATAASNMSLTGGYYSHNANLATYAKTPYHVLPWTGEAPYNYEVAEAYTITFMNGEDELQSDFVKKDETPSYSGTPEKTASAQYTYTFDGWSTTEGGEKISSLPLVSVDATYYAHYNQTLRQYDVTFNLQGHGASIAKQTLDYGSLVTKPADPTDADYSFGGWYKEAECTNAWDFATDVVKETTELFAKWTSSNIGPFLDIVGWTSDSLTLNLNGIPAAGWPYVINGVTYDKTDRADDRTLLIPYSGSADGNMSIEVRKKTVTGDIYSRHTYKIPHVYSEDEASLSDTDESSVVYVNSGSLHIDAETEVDAIYVGSQAELVVNSPLTVNTLVLRTKEFEAASLEKNSTVTIKGHAYYTRIVSDMAYHQFALPRGVSSTDDVFLSNHAACPYGTTWLLKSYDESSRAKNGTGANVQNWKELKDKDPITASVGYELYSGSAYYREFYFPVEIPGETANKVAVSCTKPDDKTTEWYTANSGWNALCSPLLGKYVQDFGAHPEDGLKVSELTSDGHYWQHPSTVIYPAVPFYYQAPETGYLDFSGDKMTILKAPRRAWYTDIPTQWLQLAIRNIKGDKLDETSIYAHPEKFAPEYEIGYDVAKQSLTGGKALIYSELPCGKLAFVAVPDSLAEQRIPLTIYAAAQEEYVFSLAENNYLGRLQHVLLHDTQNGLVIDLLERDYATEINAGTNAGRFYIQCVFAAEAPAVTTGVNSVESNDDAPQKIMYKNKVYIIYQGRVYDMTGRQCELK